MAIKPYRDNNAEYRTDIFADETNEAGVVLVLKNTPTGVAQDDATLIGETAATPAGKTVLGVLLDDVINIDTTKYEVSTVRDEVQIGNKVTVLSKGFIVTDQIESSGATAGFTAVLFANGEIGDAPASWNNDTNPHVGTFHTGEDTDGFARVYVNPLNNHVTQ